MSYKGIDAGGGAVSAGQGDASGDYFAEGTISPVVRAALEVERARVRRFVEDALLEMLAEVGDLRIFSVALLHEATELHVRLEGREALLRVLDRLARESDNGGGS